MANACFCCRSRRAPGGSVFHSPRRIAECSSRFHDFHVSGERFLKKVPEGIAKTLCRTGPGGSSRAALPEMKTVIIAEALHSNTRWSDVAEKQAMRTHVFAKVAF